MELYGTSLIGFSRGKEGGEKWQAFDPIKSSNLLPHYISASREEVNQAVELAEKAFVPYAKISSRKRAEFLNLIAQKLEQCGEFLPERIQSETGLEMPRILNEKTRTCQQIRMFAKLIEEGSWVQASIDSGDSERKPKPKPDLRSLLCPIGPVAVFCAGNFPLAYSVAGGDTISALAAGNPVIVNAHHAHPGTAEIVATFVHEAVRECGLPEGVFSLLYGANIDVGQWLVKHPDLQAVGFTGSRKGGLALVEIAEVRAKPIPVFAEMSSLNPVFILPETLKQKGSEIAHGLFSSVTLGCGQFCTKPGLIVLLNNSDCEKVLSTMSTLSSEAAPFTLLTRQYKKNYTQDMLSKYAVSDKIVKLTNRDKQNSADGELQACHVFAEFFKTSAAFFLSHKELLEETFGPVTLFVVCDNVEEFLNVAKKCQGQLTASLFGTDDEFKNNLELIAVLQQKAGRVVFNDFPTGVEVNDSIVHGGPFPATSDGRSTSVGTRAITRFVRPVCFQNTPDFLLPDELKEGNPLGIKRKVNGANHPGSPGQAGG